jgi:predicted metalloprotease with PDZ domain
MTPCLYRTCISLTLLALAVPAWVNAKDDTEYRIDYTVQFQPAEQAADVTMKVRPGTGRVKRFTFTMEPDRYSGIEGDGEISIDGDKVAWSVPRKGGSLRYRYGPIDHQRASGGYDALITANWTILRGDDLFPSAKVLQTKGAHSATTLHFKLPNKWTMVDTGFDRIEHSDSFAVSNAETSFARPVGWIIAGRVGNRFERIAGTELSVAAPKGSDVQRNDIVAFCNWILPEMQRAFDDMPNKILIVGADDPMWRGGLSGPNSIYLHSSRPLISGNYTSSLIHELVHIVTGVRDAKGYDWITEGLAEFYAVELLRRSGGITEERYQKVRDFMRDWSAEIETLYAVNSTGPRTARAALFFQDLDVQIRARTKNKKSLDDVSRRLMQEQRVDLDDLREFSESVAGGELKVFESSLLR